MAKKILRASPTMLAKMIWDTGYVKFVEPCNTLYSDSFGCNGWIYYYNSILLLFQVVIYRIYYFTMLIDDLNPFYKSMEVRQI